MPSTTLLFIPAQNSNPQSNTADGGASTLLNHLLSKHPRLETSPYTLEHRLLVDTSSVLHPSSTTRKVTHFLTLPHHLAGSTSVGSGIATPDSPQGSEKKPEALAVVVIPSQPDTLFPLMMEKMKALWLPRVSHRIDNGVSLELRDWKVRLGDLRLAGSQGQWRTRGCLCELQFLGDAALSDMPDTARAFLAALARGSDFNTAGVKTVSGVAGEDHQLIRQYMKLLDVPRT